MTEVKIIFTADLKPYVEGLKAVLSMTATAGQQLKALLSVDVKAPDLKGLESQLQAIVEKNSDYLKSIEEAAAANMQLGASEGKHGDEAEKAGKKVGSHGQSLKGLKREALESFGAISFLALGVVDLSSKASGGSRHLEKLSSGMSQGISAGFGLAGTLKMLIPTIGAWAVGIGVAVAAGVALLKFLDDSEERAKRNADAMEMFAQSLRGASTTALEEYRTNLIAGIEAAHAYARSLEVARDALPLTDLAGRAALQKQYNAEIARAAGLTEQRIRIDSELTAKQKTFAEVQQFIQQALTASIVDQFEQRRQVAQQTFKKEEAEYAGHAGAIKAARGKLNAELKRIAQEEAQFDQQIADQRFQVELNLIRQAGVEKGLAQEQIDTMILVAQEKRLRDQLAKLAAISGPLTDQQNQQQAQLEAELSGIVLQQSQNRIAIRKKERDDTDKIMAAGLEEVLSNIRVRGMLTKQLEERTNLEVIARKQMAYQRELDLLVIKDQKDKDRKEELEAALTQLTEDGVRGRIALYEAERQQIEQRYQLLIGPIQAAFDSLYQGLFESQQRTSELTIAQRQNDYDLFLIDVEKRKADLTDQLQNNEITQKEYYLRLDQLRLEQQAREADNAAFLTQLDDERKSSMTKAYEAARSSIIGILGDIVREEIKQGLISVVQHAKNTFLKTADAATGATAETYAFTAAETAKTTAFGIATAARSFIATAALAKMTFAAVASMSAIAAAAAPAATLVSIATAGGAAIAGGAAVLTAMGTVQAAALLKLADGALINKPTLAIVGEAGEEIVAPRKDFVRVFREDLMPELLRVFALDGQKNILLPSIRPDVLAAVAAGRGPSSSQGAALGSTSSAIHFHFDIENYYGDNDHFDNVIKPKIEEAMRRLGAANVTEVFQNLSRKDVAPNA